MYKLLENIAHHLAINLCACIYNPHGFKAKTSYIVFQKPLSQLCEQIPKPVAVSLKRCLSGSEFKMCLHTFQCPSLGIASVGKTALSLQSTKLYCFRGILCHSVSHGLIINIYAFSKWMCCANKHWCLVLFFNIS